MEAGAVNVNASHQIGLDAPFGGFKQSGLGREGGKEGLMHYVEVKTVLIKYATVSRIRGSLLTVNSMQCRRWSRSCVCHVTGMGVVIVRRDWRPTWRRLPADRRATISLSVESPSHPFVDLIRREEVKRPRFFRKWLIGEWACSALFHPITLQLSKVSLALFTRSRQKHWKISPPTPVLKHVSSCGAAPTETFSFGRAARPSQGGGRLNGPQYSRRGGGHSSHATPLGVQYAGMRPRVPMGTAACLSSQLSCLLACSPCPNGLSAPRSSVGTSDLAKEAPTAETRNRAWTASVRSDLDFFLT